MKLGVFGIRPEVIAEIVLNLYIRWPELEVINMESSKLMPDLDLLLVGGEDSPLPEQVRKFRADSDIVIIAISTQANEGELTHTLAAYADDYISASASGPEMVARITSALRRRTHSSQQTNRSAQAGSIFINSDTFEVMNDTESLYLTPTEFKLLYHLVNNQGRVLTHETLQNLVWGSEGIYYRAILRKYIYRVRVKLGSNLESRVTIRNLPGIGYKLEVVPHNKAA